MTNEDKPPSEPTMSSKETQHPELSVRSSSLLHELTSLPLMQSLGSLYTAARDSHWVLKSGLGMVEDTCSTILDKLHIGSQVAVRIDKAAGDGMTRLKERYPSITTPTDEMVKTGKDNATFFFHKTVRRIFRTYPGHIALSVFDWSVDKADKLLHKVNPPVRSPRKHKVTRSAVKRMQMQKEHAYASEDSGMCESAEKLKKDQEKQTPTEISEKKEVSTLKRVRRYLHAVSQKKRKLEKEKDVSPEKEKEIEARRKVSPRKRKPQSLLDQVRQSAFGFLGYKEVRVRIIKMAKGESEIPSREEAEKRKHDEILTDHGSDEEESNDDDLADFDLDNYESEEDPDYEPSDSDVISEDISDAETESDIETENVGEPGFVQLKEKPGHKVKDEQRKTLHDEKGQQHVEKAGKTPKDKTKRPDEKSSELPKDPKAKSVHEEKMPEPPKDKTQKIDEKSSELPKDTKPKPSHAEKMQEPSKDKKKSDEKPKPPHAEKMQEPSKDKKKSDEKQQGKQPELLLNGEKKLEPDQGRPV